MWYAIMCSDVPDSSNLRAQVRPRHMEYVRELRNQGRLLLAGPHPAIDSPDPGPAGMTGSLIVAEFASWEAAREWAESDPYTLAGVFDSVEVKPFRPVSV
jgi:uncharacterized protein YciI